MRRIFTVISVVCVAALAVVPTALAGDSDGDGVADETVVVYDTSGSDTPDDTLGTAAQMRADQAALAMALINGMRGDLPPTGGGTDGGDDTPEDPCEEAKMAQDAAQDVYDDAKAAYDTAKAEYDGLVAAGRGDSLAGRSANLKVSMKKQIMDRAKATLDQTKKNYADCVAANS